MINIKAYLLKFLTRKKTRHFDIKNVRKILFLRYDRIGDMVITTPVFRELKMCYPEIHVSVLASKINHTVLVNNPYVDAVYINKKNDFLRDIKSLLDLRKKNFDVCVEFDHSVIPHAILRLKIIKPKIVISVLKKGRYGVNGNELQLYDFYTAKENNFHFRDIWLETLSPLGVVPKSNNYDLFHTELQNKIAQDFINCFKENFLIGINLEGAVEGKKIEFNDLEKICKGLFEKHKNIKIIILSHPKKYHETKTKIACMNLKYVLTSYKTETILDLAALVSKFDLIITPDTSITHVASAYNKPIVTIHENNPESFTLFAPTSSLSRTVFSKSKNSLKGFSINQLLTYCDELINKRK